MNKKKLGPIIIEYDRTAKVYVARCPDTGVSTFAETRKEAQECLFDAVRGMLWSYQYHALRGEK
jgi:predicted RNase H-like HicB family nuclease